MSTAVSRRTERPLARFMPYVFGAFLILLLMSGGASRANEPHQIVARLAALMVIAFGALVARREHLTLMRAPLLFLAAAGSLMLLQLVPMPPGLWAMLPGRGLYLEGFAVAGLEPVWRPLSLTPDRTLNALLALLPALAAAIGLSMLDRAQHRLLSNILIGAILLSALLGIVQISTGALYLYRLTNSGYAVGLLANRNHQAVLLAAGFPLLALWVAAPATDRNFAQVRSLLALVMATLIVAMLLASGSRAGLVVAAVSAILSLVLVWQNQRRSPGANGGWRSRLSLLLPLALGLGAIGASYYWSRDIALQRLLGEGAEDLRSTLLPLSLQITRDFLPFGSGFGSFDPVFRSYEPYESLGPAYVNQAHNDYVQVVLEAGLFGAALVAVFLGWYVLRTWRLWTVESGEAKDTDAMLGQAGSIIVLIILASSAVDYPLRTPLMSFLFTVAAIWMLPVRRRRALAKTKLGSAEAIE